MMLSYFNLLARLVEAVLVLCFLGAFFVKSIDDVDFHGDESHWISSSYYFEEFVNWNIHSQVWNESFWTLTQPPLTRYIIGIGRSIGGYGVSSLNKPWNFGVDADTNTRQGAKPDTGLLWWSRFPMALLSTIGIFILFTLIIDYKGRIAAYTLISLVVLNPSLVMHLTRAMSEGPLLFAVTIVMLAGVQAIRNWQRAASNKYNSFKSLARSLLWFLLLGLSCGIAGTIKLSGLVLTFAGLSLLILAALTHNSAISKTTLFAFITIELIFVPTVSVLTFIALNPYLYSSPMGKTIRMIHQRREEMRLQQLYSPKQNLALEKVPNRIKIISQRIFEDYAGMHFSAAYYINLSLFFFGLFLLIRDTGLWLRKSIDPCISTVIFMVSITMAIPALFTPLDWDRYYLFPIVFSTICISIAISTVIKASPSLLDLRVR
jgi:4-amino-4-deoxy-L-arabinose transferase-like glycosyltransferase